MPLAQTLAWAATALLLAVHVVRLACFAVDWPFQDDFTQILAVSGYLAQMPTLAERLAYLFSLSVEHRIVTLRLAGWLGSLAPGGLDFRLLIGVGNAFALAAGAGLVALFAPPQRPFAALAAALLLTSVTHYGAQYWATGALQHFGIGAYAMAALFAFDRGRVVLAAAATLAAAFTAANGLMLMPSIVLLSVLRGRRREAMLLTVLGVVLFALYFIGYETPAGRTPIGELLREPLRLVAFGLASLGGLGDAFGPSLAIGAAIALAWLVLVATGAWRRVPPVVLAAMLFFALTCAAIALGRAALGTQAATISRYRFYSAASILLTLAAVLPLLKPSPRAIAMTVAVALAAAVHVLGGIRSTHYMAEHSALQRASRDHYAASGQGYYRDFPPQDFGDFLLRRARDAGTYDGARLAMPPKAVAGGMPPAGAQPQVLSNHTRVDARVLSVVGMLGGRHRAATLWLDDQRAAFRAELAAVRCTGPQWVAPITIFRGTVDIGAIPAGRYRVGYDAGARSGVAWTDGWIEVR